MEGEKTGQEGEIDRDSKRGRERDSKRGRDRDSKWS